jgi:HEAT repeat protein
MPLVRKAAPQPAATGDNDGQSALARLRAGPAAARWEAARALAEAPEAAPALGDALASEADPRVREAMFTSLAKLNNAASFEAALRHLRAEDAGLRSGALEAMQLMPDMIGQRLGELLRDADPDVRILACELARHMPAAPAAALLGGMLADEPAVNVCAAALEILTEIGTAAELDPLARLAARFPAEIFLNFSIKVAMDRISSRIRS